MKKDSNKNSSQEIKLATALSYDAGRDNAPRVVATGKGEIAEKIVEKAKEAKVPVYKDQSLAQSLVHLSLGSEIPVELYDVVAQVLAFIGRMEDYYDRGSKYE
ncbi:MAG: flagellar biogenesis protein [Clostridiaceae bacterium]|nr:flagellar biogenesis protein [Clostridiaceae bacterium]